MFATVLLHQDGVKQIRFDVLSVVFFSHAERCMKLNRYC